MFTLVYKKIVLMLFCRATKVTFLPARKVTFALLHVSIYSSLRRLEPEENRRASWNSALERAKSISDENWLMCLINEGETKTDKRWVQQSLEDDSVVDALIRIFTVRRVWHQWAMLKDSAEQVTVLDEAFGVLDSSPLAESPKDLLRLNRDTSKRLKAIRQELAASDRVEAENAVCAALFPKRLSLSEVLQLCGIVSFAYVLGTYLFTFTVFNRLQSKVVGLETSDYFYFATTHVFWVLPSLLVGVWFALPENISRAMKAYLSAEYGVSPKRHTSFDFLMYAALAVLNIPVLQWLLYWG